MTTFRQRTVFCAELTQANAGQEVTLNGWAHRVRNLGGLFFVDMRDRSGLIQLVFPEGANPDLRSETCISVTGTVGLRDEKNRNPNLATGDIEIRVLELDILNQAAVLPFPVSDEGQMSKVNEELRVKYRYLDLRRPSMAQKLLIRADLIRRIRSYLDERSFVEIETPIFTKSTPEGARDYLIPYRLDPGKFYALPQSPQQYKQLLMVAGMERYYQIAKCFRDESQRADRQPEFTQLDLEMSFVTQEDILQLMEGLTREVVNGVIEKFCLQKEPVAEFTRLTYDESQRLYGNDKPDLRIPLQIFDVSDLVVESGFGVFKTAVAEGKVVRGLRYPGGHGLSRKEISSLEDVCKQYKAKGMATLAIEDPAAEVEGSVLTPAGRRVRSSIAKFLTGEELDQLVDRAQGQTGDLLCFVADTFSVSCEALGRLRLLIGEACGYRDPKKLAFCYVVDFPLVEWNEEDQRWDPSHHPFTSPKAADLELLENDPAKVRADCYDMVCNGTEMASGSIRIHQPDVQARIFRLIGIDEEQQKARFAHILEAFTFGAPPHGGMAPGIDRLVMQLVDEENIREVMAFPKMGNGYDPLMDAPSEIDEAQWKELGLKPR
ncbi:MAG: aspartate--tRNA ligase [Fimbriimonadaceae bacterium]|nr:aspartate--tRNA ligase [Fimbriimonadaceae bacterium]